MKASEYFSGSGSKKGKISRSSLAGEQSPWLDFCNLVLKGNKLLVVDAQFVPSKEDGLIVELPPGNYSIQVKGAVYGNDRRVARLRIFRGKGISQPGRKLGETWTDTAKTAVCDYDTFSRVWGSDDDASYNVIEPFFDTNDPFGIAILDKVAGAVMAFVSSGFGDGTFPVFELLEKGERVGVEIEFIEEGEKSPFSDTPIEETLNIVELENRANHGDVESQFKLGIIYHTADGVEQDFEKAVRWFEMAAQNGNPEAAFELGLIYQDGNGVVKDYSRAKELYEAAAERGLMAAWNQLGILFRHGHGVPIDLEKAASCFLKAAEMGSEHGQCNLGVHYANGYGIEKNHAEAVKWYRLAAAQGSTRAICNLGCCYKEGLGVEKNEKEAARLFLIGGLRGNNMCTNNLGDCYETGCGVEKDLKKAVIWYSVAAKKGITIAQLSLALLHKSGGEGIKKDLKLALKWLREAAKNGSAQACFELGLLYETGEGVVANPRKAVQSMKKQ